MPIIYKPRTRYNATSGIQSAITVADPPSGYGGQPHGPHRSHAETDLLGIMIIQPGHQVVLAQETARMPAIQAVRKNARPVPFIYVIIN